MKNLFNTVPVFGRSSINPYTQYNMHSTYCELHLAKHLKASKILIKLFLLNNNDNNNNTYVLYVQCLRRLLLFSTPHRCSTSASVGTCMYRCNENDSLSKWNSKCMGILWQKYNMQLCEIEQRGWCTLHTVSAGLQCAPGAGCVHCQYKDLYNRTYEGTKYGFHFIFAEVIRMYFEIQF